MTDVTTSGALSPVLKGIPGIHVPANYSDFLHSKSQLGGDHGFDPVWMPDFLFDFQAHLVEWALRKGRAAIFADCGLGKTAIELTWAENIARKTGKRVLILTPLAVGRQMMEEGEKFDVEAQRSRDGSAHRITIANYEILSKFDPADFVGCVCDESSILKSFSGARKTEITAFMRKLPYRLLATATAAPNDFTELGTSSEALGYLGYMDMLNKFFKNDLNNSATGRMHGEVIKWRLKGHAEQQFWRWVCSWSRSARTPSDLGYADDRFLLPALTERHHVIQGVGARDGFLFELPAIGLREQREERNRTVKERCEQVADLVNHTGQPALVWCHLNAEGDLLEKLIPDAVQVSGSDSDTVKEQRLLDFSQGNARVLITKPKIGAWGLNFQHCNHVVFFPTHSYEQYYQSIRRCWRFGQKRPVTVDIVMTEGDRDVHKNLFNKAQKADQMFTRLVAEMNHALSLNAHNDYTHTQELPSWL